MIITPFLTELDSRAAIKGSRDPLGIQPLWTRLGREVIGNLTTVSNSVPDYAVLLVGFHFIEAISEHKGSEHDLTTFLKWEQIAAYARAYSNNTSQFRGVERVRSRINDKSGQWPIGVDSSAQILSDQKTYGLWGLYTVPAKSSGLIEGEPIRLAEESRATIRNEMLRQIDALAPRSVKHIHECLSAPRYTLSARRQIDTKMLMAVGEAVGNPGKRTRELFRESLLYGGKSAHDTRGRQRLLAELLTPTLSDKAWQITPNSVRELAYRANKHGEVGESLAGRLERICAAESVLAPAAALFQYLLGCDGQDVAHVAGTLHQSWKRIFQKTIPRADAEAWTIELKSTGDTTKAPARWLRLTEALHGGDYREAIDALIEQNGEVMQSRAASAPWIRVVNGKLDVRFKDESSGRLPDAEAIPELWRHAYFLQSLRDVATFLGSAR